MTCRMSLATGKVCVLWVLEKQTSLLLRDTRLWHVSMKGWFLLPFLLCCHSDDTCLHTTFVYILIIQMGFYVSSPISLLYYLNLAVILRNNFPQAGIFLQSSSNFRFQNVLFAVTIYIVYLNGSRYLNTLDREILLCKENNCLKELEINTKSKLLWPESYHFKLSESRQSKVAWISFDSLEFIQVLCWGPVRSGCLCHTPTRGVVMDQADAKGLAAPCFAPKGAKGMCLCHRHSGFLPNKTGILRWCLRKQIPPWSAIWDSNRNSSSKERGWVVLKPQHCFLVNSSHIIIFILSRVPWAAPMGHVVGACKLEHMHCPGSKAVSGLGWGNHSGCPWGLRFFQWPVKVSVHFISHIHQLLRFPTHYMAFVLAWFFWLSVFHLGNILSH